VERGHLDAVDGRGRHLVRPDQVEGGLHGGLCPPTDREGLQVLLENRPTGADVLPYRCMLGRRSQHRRGGAGEAVSRQQGRRHTDLRAPPRAVLDHRRVVDAPHHRRPRCVVLRGAQGVHGGRRVQTSETRERCRRAESVPRARAVVVPGGGVQDGAGAVRDLVAHHQRHHQVRRGQGRVAALGRQDGGQDGHPGMTLGEPVTVVCIDRVDRRGVRQGGADRADRPAVEQHPGGTAVTAEVGCHMVADDSGQGRPAAGDRDPDQVHQAPTYLVGDFRGDVVATQPVDELGHRVSGSSPRHDGPCWRRTPTNTIGRCAQRSTGRQAVRR